MSTEQPAGSDGIDAPGHPREIPTIREVRSELIEASRDDELVVPESPEVAVELLSGLTLEERELKRALARDFHRYFPAAAGAEARAAEPRTEVVNLDDPDTAFTARTKRPKWEDYFPVPDSDESRKRYERFRAALPEPMQFNLEALRVVLEEKGTLLGNPEFADAYKKSKEEEVSVLRDVGVIRRAEQLRRDAKQERLQMRAVARSHGRRLTKAEQTYLSSLEARAAAIAVKAEPLSARQEVVDRLRVRDAIDDARALKRGFVETAPMEDIISRTVPSLAEGKPLLLFGETGGAKTALARYIAERYLAGDYEFISGHSEINAYQVMGKTGLRGKEGVTETTFDPGPLYAAMRDGRPIILDEIDAMPHSFLIRLNDILQLRPGDSIRIQEDSNHKITIQEGFCVIATANMRSARYQREELDTAFLQRFRQGAGIEHVRYPDADEQEGTNLPLENYRLAVARLTDGYGRVSLPPGMSTENLINLLKAAHYSQRMFTHPASEVGGSFVDSAQAGLAKPALEKAVLAPREWLGILNQVISTDGEMSLEEALTKFVSSQTVPRDRHILAKLLASHDLLPTASETELRVAPGTLSGFRNVR